jgi:hypothetical protein
VKSSSGQLAFVMPGQHETRSSPPHAEPTASGGTDEASGVRRLQDSRATRLDADADALLTVADVARILCLSDPRVVRRHMAEAGALRLGRDYRLRRVRLDAWITRREAEAQRALRALPAAAGTGARRAHARSSEVTDWREVIDAFAR